MSLSRRMWTAALLLGLGLTAHGLLARHLQAGGAGQPGRLIRPLADLPLVLGEWRGQDQSVQERERYADEHVRRTYVHAASGQTVLLWLAYSRVGSDRGHHPEVCMAVAGQPEDKSVRQTLPLPGPGEPVQQYRFGVLGQRQWVFYWYYTLPTSEPPGLDAVQRLRRRLVEREASLTIEVFAAENASDNIEIVREFVRLVDAALQAHLPPKARRGSTRDPVILLK